MKIKKELKNLIKSTAAKLHMTTDELLEEALNLYLEEQEKKKLIEELWATSVLYLELPNNIYITLLRNDVREMKDVINVELINIPGIGPATVNLIEERLTAFFKNTLSCP